jgi:hypothetical protein
VEQTENLEQPTAPGGAAETNGNARTEEDWARHRRKERRRPIASKPGREMEDRGRHSFTGES